MPNDDPGTLGTIRFKIGLTLVLILIGATLCVIFCEFIEIREPLTYSMAVVASLAVVSSGYYLATSLTTTIQRDKVHRSFEFTKQLNQVNIVELRVFLDRNLDHQNLTHAQFYEKVIGDDKINSCVRCILGIFEDASIAVQHDYVDERTLFKSLSFLVPWTAKNFAPYVEEQRRISDNGTLYAELDKLSDAWKSKKSLKTGETL